MKKLLLSLFVLILFSCSEPSKVEYEILAQKVNGEWITIKREYPKGAKFKIVVEQGGYMLIVKHSMNRWEVAPAIIDFKVVSP